MGASRAHTHTRHGNNKRKAGSRIGNKKGSFVSCTIAGCNASLTLCYIPLFSWRAGSERAEMLFIPRFSFDTRQKVVGTQELWRKIDSLSLREIRPPETPERLFLCWTKHSWIPDFLFKPPHRHSTRNESEQRSRDRDLSFTFRFQAARPAPSICLFVWPIQSTWGPPAFDYNCWRPRLHEQWRSS